MFGLWKTAHELERVADHAERIGIVADRLDDTPPDAVAADIDAVARAARSVVEDAVCVVVGDAGVAAARRSLERRGEVRERVAAIDRRLFDSPAGDYRLTRVLDSLSRTAEHGGTVAELGLRMAIRDGDLSDPIPETDGTEASSVSTGTGS